MDTVATDRHNTARTTRRSYIRVTRLNLEQTILTKSSNLFNSILRPHAHELSKNERAKFINYWKSFSYDGGENL